MDHTLAAQNHHVRNFAAKNRLRFVRLPSGELVLPLGPRKRAASPTNHLGTHAWFAGNDIWRIFFLGNVTGDATQLLRDRGAMIHNRDGEFEASITERDLLPALDASGNRFRLWRKRFLSPEQRRATTERFASMRVAGAVLRGTSAV